MAQPDWIIEDCAVAGESRVRKFLRELPDAPKVEAFALIKLLQQRGSLLRRPHSAALGEGLFELRGPRHGVRIFYVFKPGKRIVLLDGMVKKQDRIPPAALQRMRRLQEEATRLEAREE
jgi:hypothetical protein